MFLSISPTKIISNISLVGYIETMLLLLWDFPHFFLQNYICQSQFLSSRNSFAFQDYFLQLKLFNVLNSYENKIKLWVSEDDLKEI